MIGLAPAVESIERLEGLDSLREQRQRPLLDASALASRSDAYPGVLQVAVGRP